ncbi:pyridoxamine 5'-phosphate oxidase family protein [Streptomyces jumonjinensis]|uniref:Pyridoxamine 5'-phosphate oxidase n=1 Tax=Streptomyces jumonjinensis TaxID=1945 RepID=A0A646KCL1_STRJU|nr:pyridoxamine 5'-phosphate oxidase family protein [Streptomyces jumonjinensis]MQS99869.1 pyridoxamine 5'-phosphate oxidase [Streptomyces jumonjinensis]
MTDHHRAPARTAEQRKRDVLARLANDHDAWVATASPDGQPCLVPLSFVWDRGALLISTRRTNPTARNVTPRGSVVITLGHTRDVVLIDGTAEVIEGAALAAESADAFTAKLDGWDPRASPAWIYLRVTPRTVRAWREENELAGRELMHDGEWLV